MVIAAGKRNRRVTIQSSSRAPDGKGGQTVTWADMKTVWAEMIPLRGQEALAQAVVKSVQLWKVTILYRAGITTQHRLIYDGKVLNIRSCEDPDGRRAELVMTAEGGVKN
jgi:SPP1 family predicted phage head-tail adaptor